MIQDIGKGRFHNEYLPLEPKAADPVFAFFGTGKRDDKVLVKEEDGQFSIPKVGDFPDTDSEKFRYLFTIDETPFFLYFDFQKAPEVPGFTYVQPRSFLVFRPEDLYFARMTAYHLFTWYRENQFCGRCGSRVRHAPSQRAMICGNCGNMIFPKIAPAVIVGLRNEDSILISHYAGRAYKGRALLAGFCEIGETAEETVRREVMEEVGLRVKNITYFSSQPWGIDCNLLMGYFADVDGDGPILLDEEELADAYFVKREDIEKADNLQSLTATMIEAFRTGKA